MTALEGCRIANEEKALTEQEQSVLAAMLQNLVAFLEPSGSGNKESGRVGHEPDHLEHGVQYTEPGMINICHRTQRS